MMQRLFFSLYSFVRRQRNTEIEINALNLIHSKKGILSPSDAKKYKNFLKRYDRDSFVTIDGQLMEPLNPSHTVTKKKYFVTKKLRDKLLGKI